MIEEGVTGVAGSCRMATIALRIRPGGTTAVVAHSATPATPVTPNILIRVCLFDFRKGSIVNDQIVE